MKLYDDDDDLEPVREPEADDDLAPVREPEADDDLIILEEVNSGESGVMVAAPSQTEVTKTKKRRQPVITDFLLKNTQIKINSSRKYVSKKWVTAARDADCCKGRFF